MDAVKWQGASIQYSVSLKIIQNELIEQNAESVVVKCADLIFRLRNSYIPDVQKVISDPGNC